MPDVAPFEGAYRVDGRRTPGRAWSGRGVASTCTWRAASLMRDAIRSNVLGLSGSRGSVYAQPWRVAQGNATVYHRMTNVGVVGKEQVAVEIDVIDKGRQVRGSGDAEG